MKEMHSPINKTSLKHLAELARVELAPKEEGGLLKDLGGILDHLGELRELDASGIEPMTGGTSAKNVFREDAEPFDELGRGVNRGAGVEQFPEREGGYLRVPPVFDREQKSKNKE